MTARHDELLQTLAASGVEFIVVGMTAAVLQGAPLTTEDVDIVHRRTPQNVSRLARVLRDELEAVFRNDPRNLVPQESHLIGPGHQLLKTKLGQLDCLGSIDDDKTYEDLLAYSLVIDIGEGIKMRIVQLRTLIELKKRAGRPKDLAVIPYLESTLDESNAQSG